MRTVLTPAFAKLINLGREISMGDEKKQEMLEAIKGALQFLQEYRGLYRLLCSSFYHDDDTKTLLDYIEKSFNDQEKNVLDLKKVIETDRGFELPPVLNNIEDAGGKLVSAMRELKEHDRHERVESPIPVINALIRTAYNVASGHKPARTLEPWLPLVTALVRKLDSDIERFSKIHPDEEKLTKTARKLVQDMKEGTGALISYTREKKPVELADGLRLLKYPSHNLYIILREMDRVANSLSTFSKIPALEEFHRAYNEWKKGRAEWEVVKGALVSLTFLARLYDDIHDGIKTFPLKYSIENPWSAAQITRIQFHTAFRPFVEKLESLPKDLDLSELKGSFEAYSRSVENLVTRMEEEILKVSRAPHIEELKDLVGRAINGTIVLEYFAERIQFFAQSHNEILEEFGKARTAPGNAALLGEVHELLSQQGKGMEELLRYLDDLDKKHLYRGIEKIECALPRLIEIQLGVKGAIEEKVGKGREKKIFCIKCGQENPHSSRRCGRCAAMLPFAITEGSAAMETIGGEEGSPVNIAHIEEAVCRFEAGEISASELSMEIKSYINKVEGVRHDFEMRGRGLRGASQDRELREWASSFYENLQSMNQGLETMLMFEQSPDFLYQGMQAFLAAASGLSDVRRMVKARV